jgi:acetoin utilization deacetylase AcuC-like enzyme
VEAIRGAFEEMGVWGEFPHADPLEVPEEILTGVHTTTFMESLRSASRSGLHLDADTYTTPASWEVTFRSAGGALAVASAVWQRRAQRGFALTRPPGHHSTAQRAMGFCLLNNIALAAEYLLRRHGAKRIAIVDLDLHHGNGTQDIFYRRSDVMLISTHQSPLYPGSGSLTETGAGPGEGFTANFPLPPGTGDRGFATILAEFILPLLSRFQPDMLLVSYGFDPHWRDPLGHLRLSAGAYGELVKSLAGFADEHCQGRIALFLEGGYDLQAAAACSQAVLAGMLNRDWTDPLGPSPQPEGKSWQEIVRLARQIWKL